MTEHVAKVGRLRARRRRAADRYAENRAAKLERKNAERAAKKAGR